MQLVMRGFLQVWRGLSALPRCLHYQLAYVLGLLSVLVSPRRARVIWRNIQWCFADQTISQQHQLYRKHLYYLGLSFFDTGISWFWPNDALQQALDYEVRGLDVFLKRQLANQKGGMLILGKHSQHVELDARILGMHITIYGVARDSDSEVLNQVMYRGRTLTAADMASKKNPRQFIRWLQEGKTVGYFPDQDYGPKRAIEDALLGVPAVYTTAPYTLQKLTGCQLFFCDSFYENKRLIITLEPLDFPLDCVNAFTTAMARVIEAKISQHPEEYLWAHRRFKTTKGKQAYA